MALRVVVIVVGVVVVVVVAQEYQISGRIGQTPLTKGDCVMFDCCDRHVYLCFLLALPRWAILKASAQA